MWVPGVAGPPAPLPGTGRTAVLPIQDIRTTSCLSTG